MNKDYSHHLEDWRKARFASPPLQELTPAHPDRVEKVPMRDGVELYTELFLPPGKGPFPVVLTRSPYPFSKPSRNDTRPISRYTDAGYAFVFQLTRGQGDSGGSYHFLADDIQDGYDCIEWLARQSWCNARVGMEGASYLGSTQLLAARARPPSLKCIMPTAFLSNYMRNFVNINGVHWRGGFLQWQLVADSNGGDLDFNYGDMSCLEDPVWYRAFYKRPLIEAADEVLSGSKLVSWREMIEHRIDDEYWQKIHFTDQELADLELPMFLTDGWYDMSIGPIECFSRLEKIRPDVDDRYLLVGPWNHYQTGCSSVHQNDNGDRKMPANAPVDLMALRLGFYDRYLKGQSNREVLKNRVRVYITGADIWRDYPTFPVPGTLFKQLYIHSEGKAQDFPGDGSLTWDMPEEEPADHYTYDPNVPTPNDPLGGGGSLGDRRQLEVRADVLTYTSDAMTTALTVLGDISLQLYAATDCRDTDWFAQLTEVFPDGRSVPFHGAIGALRARYRQGFDREVLLTPNQSELYTLQLGPAGHQVAVGNRLRLSLFSAAFPLLDLNSNTGNDINSDVEQRVARQTIFHDTARPSHLLLPIIELV